MSLIHTQTGSFETAGPKPLSKLALAAIRWLVLALVRYEGPADETANFSSHEWADMPVHHPVSDE